MGKTASKKMQKKKATIRFEAVKIDPLFEVLDAVAFLDSPDTRAIAQFADIDPRTAGKILKNARFIGLVQSPEDSTYVLSQPYPFKGTQEEKVSVVRSTSSNASRSYHTVQRTNHLSGNSRRT
jgi:hypothetical protein